MKDQNLTNYTDVNNIKDVDESKKLFKKNGWPMIEHEKIAEETAASIIKIYEIKASK